MYDAAAAGPAADMLAPWGVYQSSLIRPQRIRLQTAQIIADLLFAQAAV